MLFTWFNEKTNHTIDKCNPKTLIFFKSITDISNIRNKKRSMKCYKLIK